MQTLIPVFSYLLQYLAFLSFCGVIGIALAAVLARCLNPEPLSMPNLSTALFVYLGSGMGIVICALFLLAFAGLLTPRALVLTAVSGLAAALTVLAGLRTQVRRAFGLITEKSGGWLWALPLIVYSAGVLLGALRPPFSWDELSYHLPYAREYVEAGGLTVNEFLRYPLHSHNFNLLFSLALMVSDERLVHLLHGGSSLLIALGLFGTARHFIGLSTAVVAVLALFSFDGFRHLVPTAHVDLGLTLFVTLGAFALLHWHSSGYRSWLFIAAFATGLAMGTKYLGGLFAPLFGLWVLTRSRSLRETLYFILAVTLFGIWWYLRSYIIGGNPLHPFAGELFGYFLWDAQDLADQHGDLSSHAPAAGALAPLRAAMVLVFGERPELSALGLLFFAAPVFEGRLAGGLRALFAVALAYYLIWAWFLGPARYLVPIMPVMALFSAAFLTFGFDSLIALPKVRPVADWFGWRRRLLLPVLAAGMLFAAAWESLDLIGKLPTWPWTSEAEVAFLTQRYPGYDLIHAANEHPDIDRRPLYLMGFGNLIYWYEGQAIGDYFGTARYRQILSPDPKSEQRTPNADRMRALAERFGIRAVLVESAVFPGLDLESWSRRFRLLAQSELGTLWLIDGRNLE